MRRFRYPLQRLLALREAMERQARRTLAAEAARARALEASLGEVVEALAAGAPAPLEQAYGGLLEVRRGRLEGLLGEAAARRSQAAAVYLDLRAQRRSLDAARARGLARHRVEEERREARELEDLVRGAGVPGSGQVLP